MQIKRLMLFCFIYLFMSSISAQVDNKIYASVKYAPIFPGCEYGDRTISSRLACSNKKTEKFIAKNFNYPKEALESKSVGDVTVGFVVEKNGRLTNLVVEKSLCAACDAEALRVVGLFPDFVPGREKNKPLRVKSSVSIPFVVPETQKKEKEISKTRKSQKKERSTYSTRDLSKDRINRLNDGVLVVKLIEPIQKYAMLNKLANSASTDEKRALYQKQMDDLKATTDQQNKELVEFFSDDEYYSFSDVVFIYEREAAGENLEDCRQFLNGELAEDPSISIADRPYFTLQVGTTPLGEDARTVYKAFVTRASEGGVLSSPFPAYVTWIKVKQKGSGRIKFNGVLNAELSVKEAVSKYNNVMKSFYQKANDWD